MSEKDPPKEVDASENEAVPERDAASAKGDPGLEREFFTERTMQELLEEEDKYSSLSELDRDLVGGDDELERLMMKKRPSRHPILATLVIAASIFGLFWLWEDIRFFWQSDTPVKLGTASQAVKSNGALRHNTYVTIEGDPIYQTVAKGKGRSWFGGTSSQRTYWAVLSQSGHRIVVRGRKDIVTDRHKPGGFSPVSIRNRFTGRLRRLDDTRAGAGVRQFYRRLSHHRPGLRPSHRVAGAELIKHAGKRHATLKDIHGNAFSVKQASLFEIFVAFPGEYELDVHTNYKRVLNGVELTAGNGAPTCGKVQGKAGGARAPGWGGSIYFKGDPKAVSLEKLAAAGALKAPDGKPAAKPGESPVDGADRIVLVPPQTEVFNAQKRDCGTVCRRVGPSCTKSCSVKSGVEITADGGLILAAVGGACGKGVGEKHEVNVSATPHKTVARAKAFVSSLGHPFVLIEDAAKARNMVKFIVKMPKRAALKLFQMQRTSAPNSPFNIAPREEVFRARFKHLKRQGGDLLITRTIRGYPNAFEVDPKNKTSLRQVPLGATLLLDGGRVLKADISQLLELPEDAFLLEEGVKPSSMWFEPFPPGVLVFYLLLAGFIVFNLLAIRAYFKG